MLGASAAALKLFTGPFYQFNVQHAMCTISYVCMHHTGIRI